LFLQGNNMKLKMTVEFEYDSETMHGGDLGSMIWFINMLLQEKLNLHSNEIGDQIGTVRVLKIHGSKP